MPDVLKTVGRYEILREVGRGGMAMVYLARQTDLDRFVALKELAAFHASDAAFAQRFLRESRVAGSLSHPNIVTVHDYFEHDGTPYIAMEYVERGSLRPYVGNMSLAQIGGVLEGLLAGLAHAEQHGIVHRDLKPENLMVTVDGRVKIADFGIAKATNQMQTGAFLTATGTTVGTPTYMAPEQAMAQDIGPWTDLYSVGCMAFEMFTGRVPFHDSDAPMAILLRHVNEQIAPVKSIDPSIDQGVSDWVEALLVKDPKERTQSAPEAWDELEEIVIGLQGPRWRRAARLSGQSAQVDTPKPLTPAPFEGTGTSESPSEEFQSFAWGQPATDPGGGTAAPPPPGPATPPPADAPQGPLVPGPVDVPTGPPTPPPLEPVGDDAGFVTFGAPVTPPPVEAAPPPAPAESPPPASAPAPAAAPAAPADAASAPAEAVPAPPVDTPDPAMLTPIEVTPPPGPAAPAPGRAAPEGPEEAEETFDTYVAPPPPRPPTGDDPPPADPVVAQPPPPVTPPDVAPEPEAAPAPKPEAAPVARATPQPEAQVETEPSPPPAPAPELHPGALGATVMPEALKRKAEADAATEAKAKKQKPPKPPKEPKAPRERKEEQGGRRNLAFPIAAVAALAVAIVAGLALGGGGEDPPPPEQPQSSLPVDEVSSGSLAVKVPEGYAALDAVPEIPGLELDDATAEGRGGRTIAVGNLDADDSTLLPGTLRRALGLGAGDVPDRTAVSLGPDELQAYRYDDLQPEGADEAMTLYVSPNSKGVAAVACLAPPADLEAFRAECEGVADTLQLSGGKPFPVGPDTAYAETLGATFGALERKVAKGRAALRRDGAEFRDQAKAAGDIRAAYAEAAAKLRKADVSPSDASINAAIAGRLGDAAATWKKAADEARAKDKSGFDRADRAIRKAERKLARTLRGLEAAGYELES